MTITETSTKTTEQLTDTSFLDELVQLAMEEKNDVAIRLLELNAMRAEGDIDEDQFRAQKTELYGPG